MNDVLGRVATDAHGNVVRCSGCGGDRVRTPTPQELVEVLEKCDGTVRLRGVFVCCVQSWWLEFAPEATTRADVTRKVSRQG